MEQTPNGAKEMSAETLVSLYSDLEKTGIKVWIDGGWGVDALLGEQTRPHNDVDFTVQEKDLPILEKYLRDKGFTDVPRDDSSSWNFVLGDANGNEVDVHVINIRENGDGMYGPAEKNTFYPAQALTGTGTINGHAVYCMSAEYQLVSHSGYKLRDKDFHDVKRLSERFNLELPAEYRHAK